MEQLFGGGLDDVVIHIFIELPSGDLANCHRVCKHWWRVVDLIFQDDRMLRKRRRLIESRLLRNNYLVTLDKGRNFQVHPMDDTALPRTIGLPQFPRHVAFQTVIKAFDSRLWLSVLTGSGSWTLGNTEWTTSGKISSLSPQWLATFTASSRANEVAGASADQGGAVVITENGIDFPILCHLPVEKGGNSFVLLGNGDVFVTGGKTNADQHLEPGLRTYIYSRRRGEWTRCPDLPTPRFGFACGVCTDPATRSEEVWVIGGWFASQYLDVVEVYSVREGKWRAVAPFPMRVFEASIVPFGDTFLVIGGATGWGRSSHYNTEVYKKNAEKEGTGAADWTRIMSVQADNVISAAALIDKRVMESIKYEIEPIVL